MTNYGVLPRLVALSLSSLFVYVQIASLKSEVASPRYNSKKTASLRSSAHARRSTRVRGREAAESLRADLDLGQIPIVVCSWPGDSRVSSIARYQTGQLHKPELHYDDFVTALERARLAETQDWRDDDSRTQATDLPIAPAK